MTPSEIDTTALAHRPAPKGEGSSFYRSRLPAATWRRSRDDELVALALGQRVLHIGCTDAPLTSQKLDDGELLHPKLMEVSADIVGADLDSAGLTLLEQRLGGRYLHADATDPAAMAAVLADLRPTLIMAADVIEHVADVGRFITALADCARGGGQACRLVVSTPNGLSARTPLLACAGLELIHPDHRVVYTPASLSRTLADGGFRPQTWTTYSISLGSAALRRSFDAVARLVSRARPQLADGLIVVAELESPSRRTPTTGAPG